MSKQWNEETIKAVWEKAKSVEGFDPNKYRKDNAGAWIQFSKYGNTDTDLNYGWEIDHNKPESKNGSDSISNLVPRQWLNNRTKADDYPEFDSAVSSSGNKNVYKKNHWKISN